MELLARSEAVSHGPLAGREGESLWASPCEEGNTACALAGRLALVQEIRTETGKLQEIQASMKSRQRAVQDENMLLEELRKEQAELEKEQEHYIALLQEVRLGIADAVKGLEETSAARDEAQAALSSIVEEEYSPQKEVVDTLRLRLGLEPIPSWQEKQEKKLASYLEKRRKSWKEAEEQQLLGQPQEKRQKKTSAPSPSSLSSTAASSASPSEPSVKRKRGRPKGSRNKAKVSPPATAKKPMGRKRGRPRKNAANATTDESEEWTPS